MIGPAPAQVATGANRLPQPWPLPGDRLDADKAVVDRVEAALARADLSDATLQQLRADIDPVSTDLQAIVTELSPRLDAAKARVDQLGPKPTDKAPAEAPDITTERDAQTKLFNDLDATVKRAKVLAVQAGQLSDAIAARRRALFARAVLERSFEPAQSVALDGCRRRHSVGPSRAALPRAGLVERRGRAPVRVGAATVAGLLIFVVALFGPLMRLSRRFIRRDAEAKADASAEGHHGRLGHGRDDRRCRALSIAAIVGVLDAADLLTTRLDPIARSVTIGVLVVSTMVGLRPRPARAGAPNWRADPDQRRLGPQALLGDHRDRRRWSWRSSRRSR